MKVNKTLIKKVVEKKGVILFGEEIVSAMLASHSRIRFGKKFALKGFRILFFAPGRIGFLGNDTYLVSKYHLALLEKANVKYILVK